jgi:predicted DNA-binding protein with PD1-like motif
MEQGVLLGLGNGLSERVIVARVRGGADLLAAITEAVRRADVRQGLILGGIGALERAVFRNLRRFPESFPVTDSDRLYLEVQRPLELVSLGGHISPAPDGSTDIHAHFAASTVEGDRVVTLGGHLTEGTIASIKVAVFLLELSGAQLRSAVDPSTKSLDLVVGSAPRSDRPASASE